MARIVPVAAALCALLFLLACQTEAQLLNTTFPAIGSVAGPNTTCVGYTDPVNLQAKLKSARLGEVIVICSDIEVNVTLEVSKAVTIIGGNTTTGAPYTIYGSLDTDYYGYGYVQLFEVADLVGPVVFQNLELSYGYSDYYGGAVLVGDNAVASFINVAFTNNYAYYGAAVYTGGNTTFLGCVFYNNTAERDGGAVYLDNGSGGKTLSVKDSIFYASIAGRSGGAIYMYSSGGYALITDSVFAESEATEEGGAIYVTSGSNATITYTDFINGTSATGGGAVYMHGYGVFAGNSFENNQAPRGGAVYTYGSKNTSFCGGDNFTANVAQVVGLGDNVYVEYTYDDTSATSFCPAIPLGVVNAQSPYSGYSNASCINCDPMMICDKNATGILTPVGVNCTCNAGFYGSGYACYALGYNTTSFLNNLTATLNATATNITANLTRLANSTTASNRTAVNVTALRAGDLMTP
ncbi:hypothetical protein KFL_004800100 [Klebsormidium nitens]|uniref:EGF-like domain-containing protein n=1 Tax=Klebsormidium nitens TaxID=105231 RepID=A0A1Y1IDI6_KLENI|nr:hypothetical protein KFL_004800100 [Klebsormidium nitens]|eukprot:GAQ89025.1 hypothetical protein KFL_004800100 [Klebsormidium nitens]